MRRSRCWKTPKYPSCPRFCIPQGLPGLCIGTQLFPPENGIVPWLGATAILLLPWKLLVPLSPWALSAAGTALCRCIDVGRTIRKINCFCFYISIVTEAKELEKWTLGSQTCIAHRWVFTGFSPSRGKDGWKFTPEQERRGFVHGASASNAGIYTLNKQKHRQSTGRLRAFW